eukprot:2665494-Amphidinium_carterae.1
MGATDEEGRPFEEFFIQANPWLMRSSLTTNWPSHQSTHGTKSILDTILCSVLAALLIRKVHNACRGCQMAARSELWQLLSRRKN